MSERARQAALKAYPQQNDKFYEVIRDCYMEGYNQAEKDIRSERTEEALLMETGIASRLSVLRELAIKKDNDELAEKIGNEIDYIYGLNQRRNNHEDE